jgi:hypothetical protein
MALDSDGETALKSKTWASPNARGHPERMRLFGLCPSAPRTGVDELGGLGLVGNAIRSMERLIWMDRTRG